MQLIGDFTADGIGFGRLGPVPYLHADGLGDPYVVLQFRVGMADEPLELRGITHLLEHLVLSQFRESHMQINGETGSSLTSFVCGGGAKTAGQFLTDVIGALKDGFTPDRVAHEARVLKAEAATREDSVADTLLRRRFGTLNYAKSALPEYWLDNATHDALSAWADQYFHAENCTLAIHGPALPEVDFSPLSVGDFQPAPAASASRRGGGFYDRRPGPVMALACIERSSAASMAAGYLQMRLVDRIRYEAGDAYAPFAQYHPVSHQEALFFFGSDAGDHNPTTVARGVVEAVDGLIESGPTDAEVDRYRQAMESADETTQIRRATFSSAAESLTYRCDALASDEWRHRNAMVSAAEVSTVLESIRAAAIYSLPPSTEIHHPHLRPNGGIVDAAVGGRVHRAIDYGERLETGGNGITLLDGDQAITVTSETAQAILTWHDQTWMVLDDRNTGILIRPGLWRAEEEIRQAASALVAPHQRIHVGFRFDAPVFPPSRTDLQVFENASDYTSSGWDWSVPFSRIFVRGGIVLTWLADRALLIDWVEQGGREDLDAYRSGRLGPADLYDRLGGVLASDMVVAVGNEALHKLFDGTEQRAIQQIWDTIADNSGPWFADDPQLVERAHGLLDNAVVSRRTGGGSPPVAVKPPMGRVSSGQASLDAPPLPPESAPPPPPASGATRIGTPPPR